jgi:hypothetical protein
MSESDGCKGSSYINFNHGLLEIAIDPEQERGRWLLLVEHFETVGMLFQGYKWDHIKHLEDLSRVRGESDDSHPGIGEEGNNFIKDVR